MKVRLEEMLPAEVEHLVAQFPVAYVPFGTLEWHGYHLPLGLDALKAHELCLRAAARSGGAVVPPTYWAIAGMPHPWTVQVETPIIERLMEAVFEQLTHLGFRVIMAVTGHYGLEQMVSLKRAAHTVMRRSASLIFPAAEFEVVTDRGYAGDHAAKWETSLLWAVRPDLVELDRLGQDRTEPPEGVLGEDPRDHASQELGEEITDVIVERLALVAERLAHRTPPLERARYLETLGCQLMLLEPVVAQGRRLPVTRRVSPDQTVYRQFLDLFWRGEYQSALALWDELDHSMRERE